MKFLFLVLLICLSPVWSKTTPTNIYQFNLGSHTEFYNAVQSDSSGSMRKFDFAPTVGFGMPVALPWNHLKYYPEINWVLPQTSENSRIIKNILMLRGDLGYSIFDWLNFRAGTSIMWLNQQGRGGNAQMNNGNSTTTFYYPDENRSSYNNTLDLGLETIWDEYSIRLQTYSYSVFKSERRQISYTLFFSYYWDKKS